MPDIYLVVELIALGGVAGFMAGLLGVGGGTLIVPFLLWVLTQRGVGNSEAFKIAIATSMACIVFTSLSSLRAHHRKGAVRWDIVQSMAPGVIAGGLATGAGLFALFKGQWLGFIFSAFIAFSATQMLLNRQPKPTRQLPALYARTMVGAVIGVVSGLVGAGGAFLASPFLIWCNVSMHTTVATTAALGFPIALANTLGYIISGWGQPAPLNGVWGYLYWPGLLCISVTSVLVAPLGAKVAHQLSTRQLKRCFALVLYVLCAYVLWRSWKASI
jgi:uncharacterized membrane protein YfcA